MRAASRISLPNMDMFVVSPAQLFLQVVCGRSAIMGFCGVLHGDKTMRFSVTHWTILITATNSFSQSDMLQSRSLFSDVLRLKKNLTNNAYNDI